MPRSAFVLAVQAPAYPLEGSTFATESAFAQHLRELRDSLDGHFSELVLVAPVMARAEFERQQAHLGRIDAAADRIRWVSAPPLDGSTASHWLRQVPAFWRRLTALMRESSTVQSGIEDTPWRPMMAVVNLQAWLRRVPLVFVVDIDFRQNARRYHQLGLSRRRRYLFHRFVYEPLLSLQVWLAARTCQLVMLKSAGMVRDFGGGRPHVKNFYDTAHAPQDVLSETEAAARLAWLRRGSQPLRLVYFGRFVQYKGIDRMIDAVAHCRAGSVEVHLTLIGSGEEQERLVNHAAQAGVSDQVQFLAPMPYGRGLFDKLASMHVALAAPLAEDTPRAAFDAMARGLPLVAFDIAYFQDLAQASGAVALAQWPSAQDLARVLMALHADRARLADMASHGLDFARKNTQEEWLRRRQAWLLELT